jgi:hypothetical protein
MRASEKAQQGLMQAFLRALRSRPARRLVSVPALALVLVVAGLTFAGATVRADSMDERRVRMGAKFFRSLLAADVALEKKAGRDGALHVVVYGADPRLADEIAGLIAPADDAAKARIRGLPVRVTTTSTPSGGTERPAGLFLASAPSTAELDKLIQWGIAEHVIVYSPFEGHVERGVLGGLAIEAKVQPYVNARTLEAAGIELKPFFLKVAKVHR